MDNGSYRNENKDYAKFYNCTVVVPIFSRERAGKVYYGYLACDTLNTDFSNNNIYDESTLKIMYFAASILGLYYNIMDTQWGDALNTIQDELDEINGDEIAQEDISEEDESHSMRSF